MLRWLAADLPACQRTQRGRARLCAVGCRSAWPTRLSPRTRVLRLCCCHGTSQNKEVIRKQQR